VFVWEGLVPELEHLSNLPNPLHQHIPTAVVVCLLLFGVVSGGVFAATLPSAMDSADEDAMRWVAENTNKNAKFLAMSYANEWFPYFAERTVLITHYGSEWKGEDQYLYQRSVNFETWRCPTASCLTSVIEKNDLSPGYVYVTYDSCKPGRACSKLTVMEQSIKNSDKYSIAHKNSNVVIVKIHQR
jgi:hypothetical protein